jgi:hypothetical protein
MLSTNEPSFNNMTATTLTSLGERITEPEGLTRLGVTVRRDAYADLLALNGSLGIIEARTLSVRA